MQPFRMTIGRWIALHRDRSDRVTLVQAALQIRRSKSVSVAREAHAAWMKRLDAYARTRNVRALAAKDWTQRKHRPGVSQTASTRSE